MGPLQKCPLRARHQSFAVLLWEIELAARNLIFEFSLSYLWNKKGIPEPHTPKKYDRNLLLEQGGKILLNLFGHND